MSSNELSIVQAQYEHVALLAPLFDGYRVFYEQASDLEAARSFVDQRIVQRDAVIFVALGDGRALGFTQLYPSFSSVAMQRIWILNDLYVAPQARGRGVAESLLRRAEQYARQTRARRLELSTAAGNSAAQRLYEKLGWRRDTVFYHYELDLASGG